MKKTGCLLYTGRSETDLSPTKNSIASHLLCGLQEEKPRTAYPCPLHGCLIQPLARSREVKLYSIISTSQMGQQTEYLTAHSGNPPSPYQRSTYISSFRGFTILHSVQISKSYCWNKLSNGLVPKKNTFYTERKYFRYHHGTEACVFIILSTVKQSTF